ncbi:MAG: hypothetical protein K6G45_07515 [Lachnospiraceae bacterium]|nr:hypothetical protein [Lachnospiraceae bacterium]
MRKFSVITLLFIIVFIVGCANAENQLGQNEGKLTKSEKNKESKVTFETTSLFRNIKDENILNYLKNSYYDSKNLEIITVDIIEEKTLAVNKEQLICTTKAENKYVSQTANWTLEFEDLDGEWIGVSNNIGLNKCVIKELSQDEFAEIAFRDESGNSYFGIIDYDVDIENGTISADLIQYVNDYAYMLKYTPFYMISWNSDTMDYTIHKSYSESEILVKYDLSGHYEINKDDLSESFDIIPADEPGKYKLKNYSGVLIGLNWKINGEADLNFEYEMALIGSDYYVAKVPVEGTIRWGYRDDQSARFIIRSGSLEYRNPDRTTFIIADNLRIKDLSIEDLGLEYRGGAY